ncbi:cyclic nucleotide-gated ion channel 1-like [Citrus sinensis]|uniref:cyclic nucleotide-gated ion channel 1-like n=1 Tax=Citrus clementina TaxID=85681 RepID=UPI000CED72BD|nr:cyclic nucleotide-gated ion channel 1-like [Citrus x clementina]XP_052289511.1 cyclic nucleotide-gated ion channel 1-like [Citrus sinensis]XP_052289512.1 cyclic nucleotide-gated ion channel 1-like [Citrus sinensis]XP_052289513.1 cyclic nucleotide-gated ion channel 1-like [Citrus sinensis]XP_052289514.1 cyclic nucleotide-gated ion channel 1-like [Citrus sinensis]XP_052289515.1 cyclic nucleotide-gated ion channel 1-like [Citrus sinensis]XP_052289516.1 cyclic nucleotide-gated ion channel 1-li
MVVGITDILYSRNFFLFQYLLKVIRTYHLLTEATGVSGIFGESTLAIVAFNVLLYMHGSYVFGALWYFFAINKATACWMDTCMKNTGCWGVLNIDAYCEGRSGDYKFLNDVCSVKTGNSTNNFYGLYGDAFQLGIVGLTDVPMKILHCLLWGLQNLSAFGQSLQPSNDFWEIIFAICMTNYGIVLFVFLIGKMQSDTERSQKIKQMWEEIKQWQHFKDISNKVQDQIRKDKRNNWEETKGVDIDNLVNNLPKDTGKKIKRDLGRKLLKNVKEFQNWSETSLEELCDCLKPVFFIERTRIIRVGDPIDEMLFVLNGKLWTDSYDFMNVTTTASMLIHRRSRENLLEDGDFCGQELIAWSQNESSSPHLPISTRTIQALTNVEAFTLMADDLKRLSLLRHFDRAALLLQSRWRFKRLLRARRNPEKRSRLESLMYKFI